MAVFFPHFFHWPVQKTVVEITDVNLSNTEAHNLHTGGRERETDELKNPGDAAQAYFRLAGNIVSISSYSGLNLVNCTLHFTQIYSKVKIERIEKQSREYHP